MIHNCQECFENIFRVYDTRNDRARLPRHGVVTNLEQLGYDVRLIELQLAHADQDQDQVRAAYKRETHMLRLDERKKMIQNWADYLDGLRIGAAVLTFRKLG